MDRNRLIRSGEDLSAGIRALLEIDPGFAHVVDKAGPIPLREGQPGYAGLASIIVAQMVSKAAADSVWRRMEAALGGVTAEAVLRSSVETLRAAGLSGAKQAALRRIAEKVLAEEVDLHAIAFATPREALSELTAIKGVGPWTAEVYLLFCAGHPDIFPVGDVALQNACAHAYGFDTRPSGKAFVAIAERWAPFRSLAARALWAYYATEMRREATPVS